jgi:hypothetical protein
MCNDNLIVAPRPKIKKSLFLVISTSIQWRKRGESRTVRIAQFNKSNVSSYAPVLYLFEPYIIWMQADRFVLAGFERTKGLEGIIDYAQPWLCMTGVPSPVAEEKR